MANQVFIRKYELSIGRNRELISNILSFPKEEYITRKRIVDNQGKVPNDFSIYGSFLPDGTYKDFAYIPPKSITITDLDFQAEIIDNGNTSLGSGERTKFTIYNLSKQNRDFIKTGNSLILKAGYQQDSVLPTIFVGQVDSVETVRQGENMVTIIFCHQALLSNQVKVYRTYPPGATLNEIINDLAKIAAFNGIPTGEIAKPTGPDALILNRIYPFGYIVKGNLLESISKVCNENNLKSSVIVGRLYVEVKNRKEFTKIVTINDYNVKGSLEREQDSSKKDQSANGDLDGISATLFLDGRITTNSLAKVTYGPYKGDYVIKSVRHSLSYEGDMWDTKIECEAVKR